MKTNRSSWLLVAALLAVLLIVAGCTPLPRATRTPSAGEIVTFTPSPSPTSGVDATVTEPPTAQPGDTVEPTDTQPPAEGATDTPQPATATSTEAPMTPTAPSQPPDTRVPPSPTARPTDTRVPPSPTTRPTDTRVPPSATPSRTPTPTPPAITDWRGEYFDDRSLQAPPVVVRNDRVVDFQWGAGQSPAPGIPTENYSARYTRDWNFDAGNYRFELIVDDGARVWVGGNLIIDAWTDGAPREFSANLYVQGRVPIRLEYFNHLGSGRVRFNWDRVTSYPDWLGSYYKGRELSGLPTYQRNDPNIDYNWGAGAPRADMPADDFSVRWSRRLNLDRAGTYRFQIVADDGVRFWVDGRPVVDAWSDGYKEHDVSLDLAAGGHDLRLDYYEHLGGALIRLVISYVAAPATATFTPTATGQPATATFTATPAPPTFTPTATGQPPTATFTATPAPPTFTPPPPLRPQITVAPIRGEQGRALQVTGSGWPANTRVDLFVNRTGPDGELSTSVGQTTTGSQGTFEARVDLLPLQDIAPLERLEIVARTADGAYQASARFLFLGPLVTAVPTQPLATPGGGLVLLPFDPIPASAERFALAEPTYLLLDSAAAWEEHFGPEAPPADPPVDWDRDYVLGAFLGAQPSDVDAEIESVTARDGTIVVQLSSVLPGMGAPAEGQQNLPRTLIRIPRVDVERAVGGAAEPSFSIVDASGTLLAQGTPGAEPLGAGAALRSAPAPAEPGALALPAPQESVEPEAAAEAAKEAPAEEAAPEATAEAEAQAESAPRSAGLGWMVLVLWLIVVAALLAGGWLLIRRTRRD
jgi:outer membrane biosynthesis protein TonB